MLTSISFLFAGHSTSGVAEIELIVGTALTTVTLASATLFASVRSGTVVVALAVLRMVVLLATEQLALATSVTLAVLPPGIFENVTERLFPLPAHTPPPVAEQDT